MSDAEVHAYLAEVLRLDPREHARHIIELRARRATAAPVRRGTSAAIERPRPKTRDVARSSTAGSRAPRSAATRAELEGALRAAREEFDALEASAFEARLAALDLDDHPDLDRVRRRLARVNALRDELAGLAAEADVDAGLCEALQRILVEDGGEAAALRERTVRACAKKGRAARAKRFAKLVTRRYPGLAELERDWLARLRTVQRDAKDSLAVRGGLGCFGAYLAFSVGVRLVRSLVEWLQSP